MHNSTLANENSVMLIKTGFHYSDTRISKKTKHEYYSKDFKDKK